MHFGVIFTHSACLDLQESSRLEKITFIGNEIKSSTHGQVIKLFLELEFQHKGSRQTKKTRILSKILQFSRQQHIQRIKLSKYFIEKDKTKFRQNCHCYDRNLPLKEPFTIRWQHLRIYYIRAYLSEHSPLKYLLMH